VQLLFQKVRNNVNTVTGKNIHFVQQATGYDTVEDINIIQVKKTMKFCEVNDNDAWKADFIKEIVNVKQNVLFFDDDSDAFLETEDLDFIIDYLSTS
jgi:hypothetical protein